MITNRWLTCLLPFLAILGASASGCAVLTTERPLPVKVVDAETKQPIRGVTAQIDSAAAPSAWAPRASAATTADDGIARLSVAPEAGGVTVQLSAPGYLIETRGVSAADVKALHAVGFFEAVDRRPAAVVAELYAEPRPTVELVLPSGFRGQVRAEVVPRDDVSAPAGERVFSFEVAPGGAVQVIGPGILKHAIAPDFHLRFVDNAPLSRNAKDSEIGYWWLKYEGDSQLFLVGTAREFEAARRALGLAGGSAQSSNGREGQGGGRGRRGGRRGGG